VGLIARYFVGANPRLPAGAMAFIRGGACAFVLVGLLLMAVGCQEPMRTPTGALRVGDYGGPRVDIYRAMQPKRSDRAYLLDRMRVGVLTLADGYPVSAQTIFEEVYDVLRTQGINKDKTVASVVLNEDVKIWKGEPFEQALALSYYAMVQAELGSWDNARAAANGSLFRLRDFGEDEDGERIDTYEIAKRAVEYERAIEAGDSADEALKKANYLDNGYALRDSDFTLGYLLAGIANQQLGRIREADDHYLRVMELDERQGRLIEALRDGRYNTVLVVSYGLGPRKQGYGPDNSLARFVPRFPSDGGELRVRVGHVMGRTYTPVQDVNVMAGDHMWNNLADVRAAKSTIGSVMLLGGLFATQYGASRGGSDDTLYAGLGALVVGAILKAGAHVDTRYCDVMPQRFYVVPLYLSDPDELIQLEIAGRPSSKLVLAGLGPPGGASGGAVGKTQLRYIHLVSSNNPNSPAPGWATSGEVFYKNPYTQKPAGETLPYILGGNDVRPPTQRVLDGYRRAGLLSGMTLADLRELYRAEGIELTTQDQRGFAGKHLLEGGRSLVSPLPGTTGFARLFGQTHRRYHPRSDAVARIVPTPAMPQAPPLSSQDTPLSQGDSP
jgi:tetratricopeptide (TPR) repeat protein